MENVNPESRNSARLAIMGLANIISVPMSLIAIIRLNVADAIWQDGSNTPLSASQILERVLPSGVGNPENLQRLLRLLTSYGVFVERLNMDGSQRKYSLTEIGRTLVTDGEGFNCASYILQHHQDALLRAWPLVHEKVVDSTTEPFVKANGEPPYGYYGKRPEMTELIEKSMAGASAPLMKTILDGYNGFEGVERLVDVGGNSGDSLRMILKKYPNVRQGINFDLPEAVANAPTIPGVTHVGGDMFKSIPAGDGVFIKWILTTWTDDECKLIMENCYKALSLGGKFIACEPVMPKDSDDSHRTRAVFGSDIFIMTMYGGKHRTEEEYKQLGLSVGFSQFRAFYINCFFTVLEFQK